MDKNQGHSQGDSQKQKNKVIFKNHDMEAWISLVKPDDPEEEYSKEDIMKLLKDKGVCEGINESKLMAVIKKHIYDREVLVAEGRAAVDGIDGYFEYAFETEKKKKTPAIREDGSVDYTSVNVITCVNAGDIIAMYHPAIRGKAGVNVRAKILPPRPAKELKPLFCVHVTYDEQGMVYKAEIDGRVEVTKNKIAIVDLQEFMQSIDIVFGDINFKGDIIIHGNVKPGVSIIATKSITIEGVLEGADVFSGGDVIIKGGVVGDGTTKINAGGDVLADFIQYSTVVSRGSVSANVIMNSIIEATGEVHATGKSGTVVGGNVYGMGGVDAIFAGNDVSLRTVVAAGIRDSINQQKTAFERQIKLINESIKQIEKESEEVEREIRLGNTDDIKIKKRKDLMRQRVERNTALSGLKQKLEEIVTRIKGGAGAKVIIKDTIFAGGVVQIDEQQIYIEEEKRQVEFLKDKEGTLIVHPVVEW